MLKSGLVLLVQVYGVICCCGLFASCVGLSERGAWVLCKLYQRTVVVFAPCVGLSVFVLRAAMKEVCGFAALYGPKDYKMLWHQG